MAAKKKVEDDIHKKKKTITDALDSEKKKEKKIVDLKDKIGSLQSKFNDLTAEASKGDQS